MADYDSSLPMRTEDAGDVDVFISDSSNPAQKLKVNADGSIDANTSAGSKIIVTDGVDDLEVNADGSINSVVTAENLDIRDLEFASDAVDVSGSSVTVSGTNIDVRDLEFASDSVDVSGSNVTATVSAVALDVRNLVYESDAVNVSGSSVTVSGTDIDIRDMDAASDSVQANLFDESGIAYSPSNPLPVEMVSDQAGDEICDYNSSAVVAKNASVNHDYTVSAGKTLLGEQVWVSGSGKLKVEVIVNSVTKFVGFNSTSVPNVEIPLKKICKANAAEVVRITITNRDNQSQDLYSTLSGLEV